MGIPELKEELKHLNVFDNNKNEDEFSRICRTLDENFGEAIIEDYYIYSDYNILESQEYLIIWILIGNNIVELSFVVGASRIDYLKLDTIKRIEYQEWESRIENDNTIPPSINYRFYHDVGTVKSADGNISSVVTLIVAEGKEIAKLKQFGQKIRKKVLSI